MYRKIVAAVDETDTASQAVREAVAIAQHVGGELLLMHVGGSLRAEAALVEASALAQRAGVKTTMARLAADGDGIGQAIVREAEKWGADLIVVGRHNRGGVERLLLGSVSEAVVRASEIPVLLARRPTRTAPPSP